MLDFFAFSFTFVSILILLICLKVFLGITSQQPRIFLLKLCLSLCISFLFFYFFEAPLLIEAAFAEELSNPISNENNFEVNDPSKTKEDPGFTKKVGYFVWDYKWHILLGSILLPTVYFVLFFTGDGNAGRDAAEAAALHSTYVPTIQERLGAIATFPEYPRGDVKFFEDISSFQTQFEHVPAEFPTKITGGPHIYASANAQDVLVMCSDLRHPVSGTHLGNPYIVYPARPALVAELVNPILNDQTIMTTGKVIIPFEPTVAASLPKTTGFVLEIANNPYGWSQEPSLSSIIKKGIEEFGLLEEHFATAPKIELQLCYQKVVLIDPATMHYSYFHQFTIRPTHLEAMSTLFETEFPGKVLKAFYLKDSEFPTWENSYSVVHPDTFLKTDNIGDIPNFNKNVSIDPIDNDYE